MRFIEIIEISETERLHRKKKKRKTEAYKKIKPQTDISFQEAKDFVMEHYIRGSKEK